MMRKGTIYIIDEKGFSLVCSSILTENGIRSESLVRSDSSFSQGCLESASLLIASYPYGKALLEKLSGLTLPIIVLTDHIGKELIEILENLENSYCMVKPIDYSRFALLVDDIVNKEFLNLGGYKIV